jgi:hypothetical protein
MTERQRLPVHPPAELFPVCAFALRCSAPAELWRSGELQLQDAIDELQPAAETNGLVANLGQDEVQRIMAEAFA